MSQHIWNKIFIAHAILGKNGALGSRVYTYTYVGGTPSVSAFSSSSNGTGGVPARGCAHRGGDAPVPLRLLRICAFFAVPLGQQRQLSGWFSRTFPGCLSISAFTLLCPGNLTPHVFSSQTLAQSFLISCCVCSIAAHENPRLAILAIFEARRMSECSSCTRAPCLAIIADRLKPSKILVTTCKVRYGYYLNHIWLRAVL